MQFRGLYDLSYRNFGQDEPSQPYTDSFGYFYSVAEKTPPTIVARYDNGTFGFYRDGGLTTWIDACTFINKITKDLNRNLTADLTFAKGLPSKNSHVSSGALCRKISGADEYVSYSQESSCHGEVSVYSHERWDKNESGFYISK